MHNVKDNVECHSYKSQYYGMYFSMAEWPLDKQPPPSTHPRTFIPDIIFLAHILRYTQFALLKSNHSNFNIQFLKLLLNV